MDGFWYWYNCSTWFQPVWWRKDHCGWGVGGSGGYF